MFPETLRIKPDPDFTRLHKVLTRQGEPDRVPFYELFSNIEPAVLKRIGKAPGDDAPAPDTPEREAWEMRQHVNYMYHLGYDYVNVRSNNFYFPQDARPTTMTAEGQRGYLAGDTHTIESWADFERYPWMDMSEVDYSPFERIAEMMPEGMKAITLSPGGVLENVMWLLGYEGICMQLYDDPEFVKAMFQAVGHRLVSYFDAVASFDVVGAVVLGDDMGFKTQTMLSPELYRKYVFPWHKKLVEAVHMRGKPVFLHACGNLSEVMPDIVACGWDAKHSFEDDVQPVWEAKAEYGDRMAVLGGFDMDKICRMSQAEVRAHTRLLIDKCASGGSWALGTGNSVANYVPVDNYLAMLEEGFLAGRY